MNYSFTVRIFLFVQLTLDLLRVKELQQIRLKVKTGERLKMSDRWPLIYITELAKNMASLVLCAVICKLRAIFIIFDCHLFSILEYFHLLLTEHSFLFGSDLGL
jgi:hypothetical protein